MPFHPPFKDKFEVGDLVYGAGAPRKQYFNNSKLFSPEPLTELIENGKIIIMDQYAATKLELYLQKKYKKAIPSNQDSFIRTLNTHPKYKVWNAHGKDERLSGYPSFDDPEFVFGKKCKGGLYWYSFIQKNAVIHFILDDLKMETLIDKSDLVVNGCFFGKPITGCELRWIYRNRHNLHVEKCIQFWLNGNPVLPPWEQKEYKKLWQQYNPRSMQRTRSMQRSADTSKLEGPFSKPPLRWFDE